MSAIGQGLSINKGSSMTEMERLRGRNATTDADRSRKANASHSGYMAKQGGMRKNMLRRWFCIVAEEGELLYYSEKTVTTGAWKVKTTHRNQAGSVNIRAATAIRRSQRPNATDTEMEIETPERTWVMRAGSVEELEEWLRQLNICKSAVAPSGGAQAGPSA
jgi:hypothetical protein